MDSSEEHIIVAALGQLYSKASSPKESPGSYIFNNLGVLSELKVLKHFKLPVSTMYKQSPSSPWEITLSSNLNLFFLKN